MRIWDHQGSLFVGWVTVLFLWSARFLLLRFNVFLLFTIAQPNLWSPWVLGLVVVVVVVALIIKVVTINKVNSCQAALSR